MTPAGDPASLAPGPSIELLLQHMPELREIAELKLSVAFNQDSSTNEPGDILELARLIRLESQDCDGVVLVHGTDTMAFTASLLGFLLADLDKPLVLTGSQRPLAYVRSDARSNLVDAVTLATKGIPEIGICFGDHWYRGVAADKLSVHRYEAFDSPNLPPLAELGLHINFHPHAGKFPRQVPALSTEVFESSISVHIAIPGVPWVSPPSASRGVLLMAFGAGNLPMGRRDLCRFLGECRDRHLPVILITQCSSGGVDLNAYELGRRALQEGCISGGLHTRWAAYAKLGLVLANNWEIPAIRDAFRTSWAGEPLG